jgi:hypothetical protein
MELERVNVTTRDAYKPAQEPVSFEWKGKRHRIVEILDQWYEGHMDSTRLPLRYFKVKTYEGLVFILRHHEFFGAWSLLVCKSPLKE